MFLGIGHVPNAKMFRGLLDLDEDGYIRTTDQVFTRVPGRFCLRRRAGPPVPPGDHGGRLGLHGGPGGGEIS